MKKKLDQLTFVNGSSMQHTFMITNVLVVVMLLLGTMVSRVWFESTFAAGNMIMIIGLIPYLIVGFQTAFQTYNLEYFQKAKFYMVDVLDVFKYHLSQVYHYKNIVVWVVLCTFLDVVVSLTQNLDMFQIMPRIMIGYVCSPMFVGLGFLCATWFGRKHLWKRILSIFIGYIVFTISIAAGTLDMDLNVLPYYLIGSLVCLGLVYLLLIQRNKYMEV